MPLIGLEYTRNINMSPELLDDFFLSVHDLLVDVVGASLDSCKSKACAVEHYCIGNGEKNDGYVVMSIRILKGRREEQRVALKTQAMRLMSCFFLNHREILFSGRGGIQLRVIVSELDGDYYGMCRV